MTGSPDSSRTSPSDASPAGAWPIEVRGLVAGYGPDPVLAGVDLRLEPGRKILLLGPNGAGKTTLLRCLLGLLPAREGSVRLWGQDPFDPALRGTLMARCGVGLEAPRGSFRISAFEWTRFHAALAGSRDPALTAGASLDAWELPGSVAVDDLSLGQRQRLETSRALLHEPRLLLLDEPTAHLDPGARDNFWRCLDAWCDSRKASVLVSTHQLEEAADRGDEWVVLGRGRILHRGASDSFLEAFGCSRRLVLSNPMDPDLLREKISESTPLALVTVQSGAANTFRLHTPRGRQDLPAIVDSLAAQGIGIQGLGEDSTSYREAYARCLDLPPVNPSSGPPPSGLLSLGAGAVVAASFRLHALGLVRERRLVIPFGVMLGILLLALVWLPEGTVTASLLALGAVLPGGLAAGLASDLVAGERDRRYLETSLSLPVDFAQLVLGRALAILAFTVGLSWISLASLTLEATTMVPDALTIALVLSPSAMALCVGVGTWISTRSSNLRTAAQFATLASLPLLAMVQGLPLLVEGRFLPWVVSGTGLWAVSLAMARMLFRKLNARNLSP